MASVSTWSGIRNKLENDYLCPALRGHIQYFATSYSKSADHEGRAAIRIYLQSFAPDMDLQEFEERVCCVMENRMLVDVIDRALLRLKRYPDRGELYYEILTKQFIHRFNSTEKELLDELNMERSVFYDRKREAIFLLSLCLFGYAVPELQEELEMPRLYPD